MEWNAARPVRTSHLKEASKLAIHDTILPKIVAGRGSETGDSHDRATPKAINIEEEADVFVCS